MTRIIINLVIAAIVIVPMLTFRNQPYLLSLGFFDEAERVAYDARVNRNIPQIPALDKRIAIIDIDQDTLEQVGNWPWRRDKIAEFIAQLKDIYKVKMIVLPDSFTAQGDLTSGILNDLRDRFYYDEAVQVAIDQIEPEYNYDLRLLNEIDGRPLILGFEFDNAKRQFGQLPDFVDFNVMGTSQSFTLQSLRTITPGWISYEGYVASDEDFLKRSLGSGFSNFIFDEDGSVRRYNLLADYTGQKYLSLALAAMRFQNDVGQASFVMAEKSSSLFDPEGGLISAVGVGDRSVAIDRTGSMFLNFTGRGGPNGGQFHYYPAHEIVSGSLEVEKLKDQIVFIGSSSDFLNDLWRTPVNPRMPGVEIHATAFKNMLDSNALAQPHNSWLLEGGLLILLGLAMAVLYPRIRMIYTMSLTAAGIMASLYINFNVLWQGDLEFYRIIPFLALFVTMVVTTLVSGLVIEYQQKRKVEGVLNQYIPPELAKEVNAGGKSFTMEGEIREMTILFSDVRGFTTISEQFKPQDLTKLMNSMLTALSRQIHTNRGTIDKYIGDAVMAFWNAPLDDPNHAVNAVHGAYGMQQAIAKLSGELVAKGLPELKMGVGINTGEACVGNMGSEIRLSYTVMGDAVNLASRLEGITKQYGVGIIVGERTYEMTKDAFLYRPVDAVRVKGKNEAVRIYEPIADKRYAKQNMYELEQDSNRYWQSYQERRFDEVVTILTDLLNRHPGDALMKLHLERASHFLQAPPPDNWEAVTNFDTK